VEVYKGMQECPSNKKKCKQYSLLDSSKTPYNAIININFVLSSEYISIKKEYANYWKQA